MAYDFKIRMDFKDIEAEIFKLYNIGVTFGENDDKWTHLKNKEDFGAIYSFNYEQRSIFEKVYAEGRMSAYHLSHLLISINENVSAYPTITLFIEEITECYLNDVKISKFKEILQHSVDTLAQNSIHNYSIKTMNTLFERQIELTKTVHSIIQEIKKSELYKKENPNLINDIVGDKSAPEQIKLLVWFVASLKRKPVFTLSVGFILLLTYNANLIYENSKRTVAVYILHEEINRNESIKVRHIFYAGKQCRWLLDDLRSTEYMESSSSRAEFKKHSYALGFDDGNFLNYNDSNTAHKLDAYTTTISKFEGFIDNRYTNYKSVYDAGMNLVMAIKTRDKQYLFKFDKEWKNYQENAAYIVPSFNIDNVVSDDDVVEKSISIANNIENWLKE